MRCAYVLTFACALALGASAQAQTDARQGAGTVTTYPYPPTLYQMSDVSKSLSLTGAQVNRLNKITEETQAAYRNDYAKLKDLREADRLAREQELNHKYYQEWYKGARDILNADQQARYQQLYYQYGGFNTLYNTEVQKRLNMTPEQIRDLRESAEWANKQYQDIYRTGLTDRERGTQMYKDYRRTHLERFNKFLTPEQQKAWREMTGDPYEFQPSFVPVRDR